MCELSGQAFPPRWVYRHAPTAPPRVLQVEEQSWRPSPNQSVVVSVSPQVAMALNSRARRGKCALPGIRT